MATATIQVAEVGGFVGRARCFEIDPPYETHSYVTICVTPALGGVVRPKADIFPATETGACAERSLMARAGSFVLHEEADTEQKLDDSYAWALMLLGGYAIQPQDA
ncbi:hypothetical protein [Nocardia sp. NBC_00511]|uniref:hypothetical protein n=1 Tax=Nocardia sp. NBC_00511 TaxID=2903591 RepID=UPI0030E3D5D6